MKQTILTAIAGCLTNAGRIVRETTADGRASYRSLIHLRDHLGSVRVVVDGDTGSVIEASDYYPFGKRIPAPVAEPVPVTESAAVSGPLSVTEPVEVTDPVEVTSDPNPHSTASMAGEFCRTTSSATATGSATVATAPTSPNRWHFSGKESQSFLSASIPFLDFGARMYDPLTARWTAQDPLAEKYYAVSPYAYCLGNPITFIDPNGESTWVKLADNGTYVVIKGGNAFDNDLNFWKLYRS